MAKQTAPTDYGMTPEELADANAQGMTPAEWVAAYGSKVQQAEMEAAGTQGSQAPTMTGAGMTSAADSISTKQEAKQAAAGNAPAGPTTAQIEKEFANDPWSQLGAGLAKTLEEEQAPIEKAVSGQDTGSQDKVAMSAAMTTLGLSPGSGAAQWLNSNIATANKADQPMQAAMAAYGKAYETGQKGVDTALTNMGQMNKLGVKTAPYQTWLQDIDQHIQSNITYGQVVPSWAQSLPDALKYYLAQSGGTSSSGTMPLTSLTYPGSKNAGPSGSLAGVAPGSTATPAALGPTGSPAPS